MTTTDETERVKTLQPQLHPFAGVGIGAARRFHAPRHETLRNSTTQDITELDSPGQHGTAQNPTAQNAASSQSLLGTGIGAADHDATCRYATTLYKTCHYPTALHRPLRHNARLHRTTQPQPSISSGVFGLALPYVTNQNTSTPSFTTPDNTSQHLSLCVKTAPRETDPIGRLHGRPDWVWECKT